MSSHKRCIAVLLVFYAVSCGPSHQGIDANATQSTIDSGDRGRPFEASASENTSLPDIAGCLTSSLEASSIKRGEKLEARLVVKNECAADLAIVTSPVERRVRLHPSDKFPVETGLGNGYAIAYMFAKNVGLSNDAFIGDGGLPFNGLPEFAVVKAGGVKSIPVTDRETHVLPPGQYGLAILTIATDARGATSTQEMIDLADSIREVEQRRGPDAVEQPFFLPVNAIRIGPATFFEVESD